jgi:1-acyl-sn-glycerol-3-phosphate acyltransferase
MEGKIRLMRVYFYCIISIPIYAVLYLLTAIGALLCIFFAFLHIKSLVNAYIWFWARTSFFLMGAKFTVHGVEYFDKSKNYLLLTNHSSLFDIMAIMAIDPDVSWFGREYLTKIPVFGYFLKTINYIPMKTANVKNTKIMLEQLVNNSKGLTIAMFPEGTRTIDGKIQDFRRGFIHVLRAAELEILPVTLKGLYEIKPKTRWYIKFGTKVDIFIHKPIAKEILIQKDDKEIISTVKNIIESGYY